MSEQNEQQSSLTITKRIAELVERGELAVVVTVVRGENAGAKLVVDVSEKALGSLGSAELDAIVVAQALKFFARA